MFEWTTEWARQGHQLSRHYRFNGEHGVADVYRVETSGQFGTSEFWYFRASLLPGSTPEKLKSGFADQYFAVVACEKAVEASCNPRQGPVKWLGPWEHGVIGSRRPFGPYGERGILYANVSRSLASRYCYAFYSPNAPGGLASGNGFKDFSDAIVACEKAVEKEWIS